MENTKNQNNNFINLPTSANIPFPQLVDIIPSSRTVQILKELAYSAQSEMTALATYLYQDWALYPTNPDIANEMEKIGVVEMTHLDALSNAIVSFGGKPNYTYEGSIWSANNVNFSTSLPQIMYENIRAEQRAISDYEYAIEHVDNQSLKEMFKKIIADERNHIAIFQAIIDSFDN